MGGLAEVMPTAHQHGDPPPPRTWGEAHRRHAQRCQRMLASAKWPGHSPKTQAYLHQLFLVAMEQLEEIDKRPKDAPYIGRKARVPCSTASCDGTQWEDARRLYDYRLAGRPAPRLRCEKCRAAEPPAPPPPRPEPISQQERDELVQMHLARALEIAPQLFGAWDTPRDMALWSIGRMDQLHHDWDVARRGLESGLRDKEAARVLLVAALEDAGLGHLLDVPEEEESPEPPESPGQPVDPLGCPDTPVHEDAPEPSPGELPADEPDAPPTNEPATEPDEPKPDPDEPKPDPSPWIF